MDTNTTPKFSAGQLVKFADPMDADEAAERYVVLEYRCPNGPHDTAPDRVLVGLVCDMAYPPTSVFTADELELA